MGRFSAVGFFAFVLCLSVCVSASVTNVNTKEKKAAAHIVEVAKTAVEAIKNSTKEVCEKAQNYLANLKGKLEKVEDCKAKSEKAEPQGEAVVEGKQEATHAVQNQKEEPKMAGTLKLDLKEVQQNNFASLCQFLIEAKTLEGECNRELSLIMKDLEDYKDTSNNNISYLQKKSGILTTNITTILRDMNGVQSTEDAIDPNLKKAQLANLHVSGIVAVAKIQTMIKEADINIKETQNKRNEVNAIVQEILKVCKAANTESNKNITALCERANGTLTNATDSVEKAKKNKEEIEKQKEPADSALTKVQQATDVKMAQEEVYKAQACVVNGKECRDQLLIALETAKKAVTNAKALQQKLLTALSTTNNAPNTEETTETKKSHLPRVDGTGPHQTRATQQSTTTNTEQPTSKDSIRESDNNADKLKDKLIKDAQNLTTTQPTGRKAPAPGAKNDSAMTDSMLLVVALIATAVLQ